MLRDCGSSRRETGARRTRKITHLGDAPVMLPVLRFRVQHVSQCLRDPGRKVEG